jgi:hypothetical protein
MPSSMRRRETKAPTFVSTSAVARRAGNVNPAIAYNFASLLIILLNCYTDVRAAAAILIVISLIS